MNNTSPPCTTLFPKEEKVGYRQNNQIIIFSATSVTIELSLLFPFPILFYSLPFDDDFILIVSSENPSSLILWNIQLNQEDTLLKFESPILSFIYSGAFSCVVTDTSTFIVRSRPLVIHHSIPTQAPLTAISLIQSPNDNNHCVFAYGDDMRVTSVNILTIPSSAPPVTFEAHKAPIRAVALSNNGKYIATVSNKGTIIRLWTIDGKLINESRRGLTPATIMHMSFSPCSEYLCVSSNHFTSHIFKVEPMHSKSHTSNHDSNSWLNFLPKADITVSIQDTKTFSSFILAGGSVLCSVTDKGVCEIYDIDQESNKCNFKSRITIPKIASVASAKISCSGKESS
ncbi:hypothetical protein TRFO_13298 [Tritrichomonas foetus]|uniref:Uncharacterized protein n=1 Tax=Tritrichomonas foetus TaxID=1144522 RepID=A0A1J4KYQ7_9EUKA|nr:hypothetical protein TRFO_13298 [Tritrichomonas foetus]|eukprot:OHT16290.1 hypothetical protein TRFO_13298 [Tritrichomonas foetus]